MNFTRKALILIMLFFLGLLLIAQDHRGIQIGEQLFRAIGISPSIKITSSTLHFSNVISMLLVVISGIYLVRHLRLKYKHVAVKVIISAIIVPLVFPTLSYWFMLATHINKTGLTALDYSQKESSCGIQSNDKAITYNCKLTIINYGSQDEQVLVRPLLDTFDHFEKVEIQEQQISIPPRSRGYYRITFTSLPTNTKWGGHSEQVGVAFIMDGEERVIFRKST